MKNFGSAAAALLAALGHVAAASEWLILVLVVVLAGPSWLNAITGWYEARTRRLKDTRQSPKLPPKKPEEGEEKPRRQPPKPKPRSSGEEE